MADWRARLEAVKGKSVCRITTRGRRTGKRHTVTIWFAVGDDGTIYLGTLRLGRDWPKNVRANPEVELEIGDLRLKGEAHFASEDSRRQRIESKLVEKYWIAWIGSWFGLKPEGVLEVKVLGEAA